MSLLRALGAWLLAVFAGGLTVGLVEAAGHFAWPPPADLDASDPVALANLVLNLPLGALLALVLACGCGAFVGAFVGTWLARSRRRLVGALAGAMTLLGTLANLAMIPHPSWMMAAGPLLVLVGIGAGCTLGARRPLLGGQP